MVAGFVSIEPDGHIDFLFVHKARQRQGIGSALLDRAIEQARLWGLSEVFTEASITARPFFKAHGFAIVKQQTVICRGVEMTNFVMEKTLVANKASQVIGASAPQPER